MLQNLNFLVAGGDARYLRLAQFLSGQNRVYTMGLSSGESCPLEKPDYLILPMAVGDAATLPTLTGETLPVEEALSRCGQHTHLLIGGPGPALQETLRRRGISYTDYQHREDFAVANAVPTAEGAMGIALQKLPYTLFGLPVLILGYGRIGRVLADRLHAMGSKVTVAARQAAHRRWIEAAGCAAVSYDELPRVLPEALLILNTVPAPVLQKDLLRLVQPDCLLLELASKPGGIDLEAAKALGLQAEPALSLPGKTAPVTAARLLFETVEEIHRERRGPNA